MLKLLLSSLAMVLLVGCSTVPQVQNTDNGIREVSILGILTESTSIQTQVDAINQDPKAKEAIIFINSGGGGVTASMEIYQALSELKVPAVAYCYEVCASGAMLVAMSPTVKGIYGSPGVICGSIGVIAHILREDAIPNLETYRSGSLKQASSHPGPPTEEEKQYLQQQVQEIAEEFYLDVAKARGSKIKNWDEIKTARVFFDNKCVAVGLLDKIETKEELIRELTNDH